MKKKIITIIIVLLSVLLWACLCYLYQKQDVLILFGDMGIERVAYALSCSSYILVYSCICHEIDSKRKKMLLALGAGFVFTIQAILLNNYLRYLEWNAFFKLNDDLSLFLLFVRKDIGYSIGWGEFRYPFLFVLTLLGCMGINAWRRYAVNEKLQELLEKMVIWFLEKCEEEIDEQED